MRALTPVPQINDHGVPKVVTSEGSTAGLVCVSVHINSHSSLSFPMRQRVTVLTGKYRGRSMFGESELWENEARADPHAFYARVREAGRPVLQTHPATGERLWIVARHADVLAGLRHPSFGHQLGPRGILDEVGRIGARQLIDLDPPDHTRLRRIVSSAFTARTVARLEPWIRAIVD